MKINYKCKNNHITEQIHKVGKIPPNCICSECSEIANRIFGNVSLDREPDSVSWAISTMKYSDSLKKIY
jgi:hypothetical protein